MLAMGDLERVRTAITDLMPEHDRLQREASLAILPDWPFQPSCTVYGEGEWNPFHEYVRQINAERDRET